MISSFLQEFKSSSHRMPNRMKRETFVEIHHSFLERKENLRFLLMGADVGNPFNSAVGIIIFENHSS